MRHTKGPWQVKKYSNNNKNYVVSEHGTLIHEFYRLFAVDKANAELISAAPEMLEALDYLFHETK